MAATKPANDPAPAPAPTKDGTSAESQMGEEPVAPQADPAPTTDPASEQPEGTGLAVQEIPDFGTWGTCSWEIDADGKLTIHPGEGADRGEGQFIRSPWNSYSEEITSIVCQEEDGQKIKLPANSSNLFFGFEEVETMDLSGVDTSSVANMCGMFDDCSELTSIAGLSNWSTSSVANMSDMFHGCSELTSLDDISDWDVSTVTSANGMFSGCSSLASLDLSGWNVAAVTNMFSMFRDCSSLTSLGDLSSWNVLMVTDMGYMFDGCSSLTSVGSLSDWDVTKVQDMMSMFFDCSKLASLDLSSWDTSNVRPPWGVFLGCSSLVSFKVGPKYAISDADMFPDPTGYGKWWSTNDSQWFTKDEIISTRKGVADTYVCREQLPDMEPDAWYEDVVHRAVGLGLLGGYGDGNFGPNDMITRGQVAVVLWRMANQPEAGEGAKDFDDVTEGEYYYEAVRWASGAGVVSGYEGGNFGPNDNVTREQLAAMLANYAQNVLKRTVEGSADDYADKADGRTCPPGPSPPSAGASGTRSSPALARTSSRRATPPAPRPRRWWSTCTMCCDT